MDYIRFEPPGKSNTLHQSVSQFSRSVMSDPLRCHESQHARPPLSITNSRSSPKLTSIESLMPSSHLILYHPLLLLPPIPPSIKVFSNELNLHMRWPKNWSSEWTCWISLQSKELSGVFSNTTVQKHQFFGTQLSSQSNSHIHT